MCYLRTRVIAFAASGLLGWWIGLSPARAVTCGGSQLFYSETGNTSPNLPLCSSWGVCRQPVPGGVSYSFNTPGCNPLSTTCGMTATVPVEFPGNHQNDPSLSGFLYSFAQVDLLSTSGSLVGRCGASGAVIRQDLGTTTVTASVTCSNAANLKYTLRFTMCPDASPGSCTKIATVPLDFAAGANCPVPPPPSCPEPSDQSSGASGLSCPLCQPVGDCGVPVAGGGPSCQPSRTAKAQLRYAAGSVGGDGLPGSTSWRTTLGRFWSHDYAERIVVDPDTSHVWLLTRYGSFREFSNLAAGSGLRLYQSRAPSDEFRKLYFDTATGGWELHTLDGRKDVFRSDGLWLRTVFASDPSHSFQATYNASNQLVSVGFPDGRSDSFTYHPSGKLASITEVAVTGTGTPSRTWTFTWSGDELTSGTRPDGTAWQFLYDPTRPGYLTRVDLATGPQLRVMAAFEYAAGTNNVARSWRGDPLFTGPNATDKVTYSYTNPTRPTQAVVTRTISATFNQITTYNIARDTVSVKPKLTAIQGSCPTCGLSPMTTFTYAGSHPLLPSSVTDAKGTHTDYTYNADGRLLTRIEAANVPGLDRVTTYSYNANFPGLVSRVEVPSTSGGSNVRRTDSAYDPATGLMTAHTVDGFEAGAPLPADFKTTAYGYNASGEILTVDPSGFGTADVTSFTYNLAGRNGHLADSRTDPLVGTTSFGYDGLNRRTSVTDVNGVETQTSYDALSRVIEVRQKGAIPADDLVTTYTYNSFGDLFCVKLPRGNGMEYLYDPAGRLLEVRRGTAVATPTSTSCLDAALPRERTAYQLDNAGNRIEESLERWNGTAWVSDAKTAYEYTCHLDRVTQGAGSATPSVTENCYDLNENLEKVWDPNHPKAATPNPTQLYAYDALNRLTSVTVGPGTTGAAATTYGYDVQDHLASVTDAEGNVTTYTTSDRDLLTQQVSPVSGTTNYAYNEHGQLVTTTDARSIVTTCTVDAADRVTQETFGPAGSPDPALTTTYAYGSTAEQFDIGRLIDITRNSQTIPYTYDRFGRVLQDGGLIYEYDPNGNRTEITYPGGVSARYAYDFADRQATLDYDSGAGSQPLVTSASYKALGPLTNLAFANGLSETRLFDARYFPDRIQAGSLLDWDYSVDAVGNPTAINGSIASSAYSTAFAYQDALYFLTQGDGPWGNRAWTYDKIGNRLSFARTSEPTQSYTYSGTGHNPKLAAVTPAPGWGTGSWAYSYDPAGNQTSVLESNNEGAVQTTFYDVAADGRMSTLRTDTGPSRTDFLYDGRGFLRQAFLTAAGSSDNVRATPVYSSDGMLMARTEERQLTGAITGPDGEDQPISMVSSETAQVFYFAGRPVAQLTSGPELLYLTTDHLGTPVLATDSSGATIWAGGVEPFGETWTAGPDNPDPEPSLFGGLQSVAPSAMSRLSSEKVFLRYPGQWVSDVFRVTSTQREIYYNVHRWFEPATGRYTKLDPLLDPLRRSVLGPVYQETIPKYQLGAIVAKLDSNHYAYVDQDPIGSSDYLGLQRNCQNQGCDMVPNWLENNRRRACCVCHDTCFFINNCGVGSWFHTILTCLVPVIRRTPCDGCNRFVTRCFGRSLFGWDTECPWQAPPPEQLYCQNPEPPVVPPVPIPPPSLWGPPPQGPWGHRTWGPEP
jgi:YD repeat-containing protein